MSKEEINPTEISWLDGRLLSGFPSTITSGGTLRLEGDSTIDKVTESARTRPRITATKPAIASPASSSHSSQERRKRNHPPVVVSAPKKSRYPKDSEVFNINDDYYDDKDDDDIDDAVDFRFLRHVTRKLRDRTVDQESVGVRERQKKVTGRGAQKLSALEGNRGTDGRISTAAAPMDKDFVWSDDFTCFTGQKESYLRDPGPSFSSQDPEYIFSKIWDHEFMAAVVSQTNDNAWGLISQLSDPDMGNRIPNYLECWTDVTVEELYRFFAVLILMSFCHHPKISDYWHTGILGMPEFREIMSRNRFLLLNKFLHFVCKENLVGKGNDRRIKEIAPVVDHCNKKFAELYTPSQYLSLDESLLLWKGRLSWKQNIQSQVPQIGIKSFELCEAETGYLLQYRLYTGKGTEMHSESLHGFQDYSAKVVLDLMEGYLNVGHVVVMDNWYNQLALTRHLKSRRTDVLGTLHRQRVGMPQVIKDLNPNQVERGWSVSRHSGDIALVAWKDVKLVTIMSTYHQHEMVTENRAGQGILKPVAIQEYHKYMGGVNLKDQKLSMFLMERKRKHMWYMKVFNRLLNASLLNAYIIYTRNPMYRYSHRQFRMKVAEALLTRYPRASSMPPRVSNITQNQSLRLQPGRHFPMHTEASSSSSRKGKRQLRCVRCTALNKRVLVTSMCKLCMAPLCLGKCWEDYHTVINL